MASINQNTSVVNVGRTTPVTPGAQVADKSIPVVMATDQTSIPVVEQNKVQSEVALSLLGIPRAEVALGIFADVNTYDVNPSEWSMKPEYHVAGDGVQHLPTEAGALVEASRNKTAVLTSKRFFRYQPGRVSAATFGVKSSVADTDFSQNPSIRKFGIYDKYDGYYWESRNDGQEDNFAVVRRTQSLQYSPVSPYGVGNGTTRRGETTLKESSGSAIAKIDDTQTDDYRIVGLGASESISKIETLLTDRNKLKEKRYELIDAVLGVATGTAAAVTTGGAEMIAGYGNGTRSNENSGNQDTSNTAREQYVASGSFYTDFARAYNAHLDYHDGSKDPADRDIPSDSTGQSDFLVSADQMQAKCKRDLDYWIDNFLLDLEYGGSAHTKWNTTNFALSDGGSNWSSTGVGVFPRVSVFEALIHKVLLDTIHHNTLLGLSADGLARLQALQTIVADAFGGASGTPGDGADPTYTDTFTVAVPSNSDYGIRTSASERIETFMTTKRNFWSYYVTTKSKGRNSTNVTGIVADRVYTVVSGTGDLSSVGGSSSAFVGHVFKASGSGTVASPTSVPPGFTLAESIVYEKPGSGTSGNTGASLLAPFAGLTDAQMQQIIKDKCQRDVGYIVDGYKNDLAGGGDAETTYNASMFIRGTGLSVYSQQEKDDDTGDFQLSEIARHEYLKTIIDNDLKTFGLDSNIFRGLADKIISNFSLENTNTLTTGKKAFPGNLVVLRDGLIHTHAAIYDPSLLKDSKPVKAVVTPFAHLGTFADTPLAIFKLTDGIVTFGQHVKITWNGGGSELEIGGSGNTDLKIYNGETLRVRRVLGPKGNEFTLVKEDNTPESPGFSPVILTQAQLNAGSTGTIYIDTVVPFVFPKDYDISNTVGNNHLTANFTSEIDTTVDTLVNNASNYATGVNPALNNSREFNSKPLDTVTQFVPKGAMFPYMYATNDNLQDGGMENSYIGFINTALQPTVENVDVIRSQMDNVNFYPEYVNWIKNNVRPEYWGVYEYRVPRSRFSHDALDGISSEAVDKGSAGFGSKGKRNRVYSDVATGPSGTARPGQLYTETDGVPEYQNSLYDYDFTKVTMLKIEFSWYGAVGALFLAYVPVGNGEARWVRVHHLRASNQLKIASLGNATLPITYTTYGGGDSNALGDGETYISDYNTASHNIVKYGASYYIDGGDRGTVRLYSHNNDDTVSARGKRYPVGNVQSISTSAIDSEATVTPYLTVTETYPVATLNLSGATIDGAGLLTSVPSPAPALGDYVEVSAGNNIDLDPGVYRIIARANNTSIQLSSDQFSSSNATTTATSSITGTFTHRKLIDPSFYIGGKVKTSSIADQNIKVIWAETTGSGASYAGKAYLSTTPTSTSGVHILADRAETVYGVETKKTILSTREQNAVRNRVQVYPTKLSTANLGSNTVRLRFKKTPTFQTDITPDGGGFTLTADYTIDNTNSFLPTSSSSYLNNGEETYGWFRGRIGSEFITVFGRLYKETDYYYFQLLETYEGTVTLVNGSKFIADKKFHADGSESAYSSINSKSAYEKEGLSSVKIASNTVVPIPNTGVNVATLYLRSGTEQFDLDTYFDYNKEYLSFPLTDIADTLYFAVDSDTASTSSDEISLGVTWEEQ